METRPLDPNDPAEFTAYAGIHRRALEFENPYATPFSEAELHVQLARPNPAERLAPFAGYDGDVMVAAGLAVYWLIDNTEKVRHDVWVAPKNRRKGFGSAMEEFLVDEARRQGRTTLLADFGFPFDADDSYPSRRFAARHGFTLANYEVHRILDLPVDNAFLDELVAAAEPFHRDYELREYVDDIPHELVPSYCDLINSLMTDAPSGDIDYESGAITPGIFHELRAALREQQRTMYQSVAIDRHGQAVAHSELVVSATDTGNVFQWATLVRREHRGHRLGVATKARNLRVMQAAHPDRKVVHTWNAESNTYMIAVNETLGFRKVEAAASFQRRL